MTCPKCKSKDQWGNFCSNCGIPLKEKCRECGKMEIISRKVCQTKLEEANKRKEEFFAQRGLSGTKTMIVCFAAPLLGGLVWVNAFYIFLRSKVESIGAILAIGLGPLIVYFSIVFPLAKIKMEKIKKEFLLLYPAYAELIKKAEGK